MKTRFARVLCMALPLAVAAALLSANAQTLGPELLVNGNFELGSGDRPTSYRPTGWATQIDGGYWNMTTNISPAPTGTFSSPNYVGDGYYSIRRVVYQGQSVGTTVAFNSDTYDFSALSESISAGDQLAFSFLGTAFGSANRFYVQGRITFFEGVTELASFDTAKIVSHSGGQIFWTAESITVIVPENATGFRVSGIIGVDETLAGTVYSAFDNFSVKQVNAIPESSTVAATVALLAGAAAAVGYRRKHRK